MTTQPTLLEKLQELEADIEVGECDVSEPGDYLDYDGNCIVVLKNDRRAAIFLGSDAEAKALAKLFSLADKHLPRLIAALELVEKKSKRQRMAIGYLSEDNDIGLHDGEIHFAREVLATLEGKK